MSVRLSLPNSDLQILSSLRGRLLHLDHGSPAIQTAAVLNDKGDCGHVSLHSACLLQPQMIVGDDISLYGAGDPNDIRLNT